MAPTSLPDQEEGPDLRGPALLFVLFRLLLVTHPGYGPVIVMYAPVNPSNVSVYVKLLSIRVPG